MNKTLLLAAAAGLSVSLVAGVPSDAQANLFPAFCKQLQAEEPELFEEVYGNLGACIGEPGRACQDPEFREFLEIIFETQVRNRGQCVSFLRHLEEEDLPS